MLFYCKDIKYVNYKFLHLIKKLESHFCLCLIIIFNIILYKLLHTLYI